MLRRAWPPPALGPLLVRRAWSLAKNGWILQIVASALRTEAQECTLLTNVWHCVVDMDSLKSQKFWHLIALHCDTTTRHGHFELLH